MEADLTEIEEGYVRFGLETKDYQGYPGLKSKSRGIKGRMVVLEEFSSAFSSNSFLLYFNTLGIVLCYDE